MIKVDVSHDMTEITIKNIYGDSVETLLDISELEKLMDDLQHAWLKITDNTESKKL